jgi:cysteine desulfurase
MKPEMRKPVYLDYNATTPVDAEVLAVMKPYLEDLFGNPSSSHYYGMVARRAMEEARAQVAALLHCAPDEIIFTSGGTESNNFAIKGSALAGRHKGTHIITSSIEHPAVTEVCRYLESQGFTVTYLPVDDDGLVDPGDLEQALTASTVLVTVMHANNEVGTIQPIEHLAAICRDHGVLFHTDAAQSAGKIMTDVVALGVDLLSLAGHKLYAPKGVGALYVRRGVALQKLIHGADHELDRRAGTENVPELAGLGKACEIAARDMELNMRHMKKMRDRLHDRLSEALNDLRLNGHPEKRLPNTLSLGFGGVDATTLLGQLREVAASAGAACHVGSEVMSSTLAAMHVPARYAAGTIRFSVGKFTTADEIERAAGEIINTVNRMRLGDQGSVLPASNVVKLTHYTHGLGCACKLRPQDLEEILNEMPVPHHPDILVGMNTSDDAAVYRLDDHTALIQTLDFLTPIVDDPYHFGAIAAANALSDVYAMGGKPVLALNIVAFPSRQLPLEILKQILKGAEDKAGEAGVVIVGGHTIEDNEPKYGLAVTGFADPGRLWRNATAQPGDAIILTKPLGTGLLSNAMKRGLLSESAATKIIEVMSQLNGKAAAVLSSCTVHACTDVSGFGLAGHLLEMTRGSHVDATIHFERVPVLEEVWDMISANIFSGGTKNNLDHAAPWLRCDPALTRPMQLLLCDALTSGGLLVAVPVNNAAGIVSQLHEQGMPDSSVIGHFNEKGKGTVTILMK